MKLKLFLVLLFSLFIFTACSNTSSNDDGDVIELDYWNLFGGGNGDRMDGMVEDFNESQSEIHVNSIRLEWGEYYTKLMTGVAGGEGPDIGVSHVTKLPELVDGGIIYDIDELVEHVGIDWNDYNQTSLEPTLFDGKHYAIPLDTHPLVMYYNKDLLDEAGLLDDQGAPVMENSAEGFVELLIAIKENSTDDVIPLTLPSAGEDVFRLWWALYHQLGGNDVISDDLADPSIDMDKAVHAAGFINDLYHTHEVVPLNLESAQQYFENGTAAIMIQGTWGAGVFERVDGLNYDVMPMSSFFEQTATWGDSHTIVIPTQQDEDPERLEASIKFAKYISDEAMVWSESGQVPSKTSIYESDEYQELVYGSTFAEVAQNVVFPKQSTKTWPIKEVIIDGLDQIWIGDVSAEEAFSQVEQELGQLLSE